MNFTVIDQSGQSHACSAEAGTTLMQAIRDEGLEIAAQCGGCCSCATCHVYVSEDWKSQIPSADDQELAMLDLAIDTTPRSRLSCQLIAADSLEGIVLELAPGTTL